MSVELTALGLARTVAKWAASSWLGERQAKAVRELDLGGLVRERIPGLLPAREVERLFEGITDAVMRRMQPMLAIEFSDLDESERLAAAQAVVDTLAAADIDDTALFKADARAEKLAAELRRRVVPDAPSRALLSEPAAQLYALLLEEACDDYVRILVALPPFVARAEVEELGRLSRLEQRVSELLARLPARTLYAPAGDDNDEEFRREYLKLVLAELDGFELYGADFDSRVQPKLSLAYVPLKLAADLPRAKVAAHASVGRASRRGIADQELPARRAVDVESALARRQRAFIRADAGAGKTTLLRWLAVTAARGGFTGPLVGWNGLVPFLVRLRSLPNGPLPSPDALIHPIGTAIAGHMPTAWIDRLFRAGHALLLVDGVDELARDRRPAVREWLAGIVTSYPTLPLVVTARPTAAGRGWLENAGFAGLVMAPMDPDQLRQFIARWHDTVRASAEMSLESPSGVRDSDELARRERVLQQRLAAAPHLRTLAANPLLAALLCTINLNRGSHLPRNRIELYDAALETLLHRRDTERGIDGEVDLEYRDKLDLHADLAYRLTLYGHTELREDDARRFVTERLAAMPRVSADPEKVFEHLRTRCGVLREPAAGRIDFVHRTFQEYLAARALIAQSHLNLLIDRAHRDTWRETVIMAAGLAGDTDRARLLSAILDRAAAEHRRSRKLRLLAIGCLETANAIPDEYVRERVYECLASLMPPRDRDEARILAVLGTKVLHYLPDHTEPLSAAQAEACIRVAALVGGEQAMCQLARYNTDSRWETQTSLLASWKYFEPGAYAATVLADAALEHVTVHTDDAWRIPHLGKLTRLRSLGTNQLQRLDLCNLPTVRQLIILEATEPDIETVSGVTPLESLIINAKKNGELEDISPLRRLSQLQEISVGYARIPSLDLWQLSPKLTWLGAHGLTGDIDLAVLRRYPHLRRLDLTGEGHLMHLDTLAALPLEHLWLGAVNVEDGIDRLTTLIAGVHRLTLNDCPWVSALGALSALRHLTMLQLRRCTAVDLTTMPELPNLDYLDVQAAPVSCLDWLATCPNLETVLLESPANLDLTTLPSLPRLTEIWLSGARPGLDISPLAKRKKLAIYLYEGQLVTGADQLGRGVTLRRIPAPPNYDPEAQTAP